MVQNTITLGHISIFPILAIKIHVSIVKVAYFVVIKQYQIYIMYLYFFHICEKYSFQLLVRQVLDSIDL